MKLSDKLDKLIETVTDIKVEQAKQGIILQTNTEDLKDHMRRTEIAEQRLDLLTADVQNVKTKGSTIWQVLTVIGSVIVTLVTLALNIFKS